MTLAYAVLALAMTWPLALGLTHDLPADLIDPVLNCWVLAWDAEHLLRLASGDLEVLRSVWDANIYYPHLRALAYSEHLLPQALQVLPIYALTRNAVLCHNVLFLSTFVLSGLGAFLLVRDLVGDSRAAALAGLLFAFAPFRLGNFSHVQVMTSQWMPFAFLGLHRFFARRRAAWLLEAAAALVAQGLSCGYYLYYFSPFVAAWALFEILSRRLAGDLRTWALMGLTALSVAAATLPFLVPYAEARVLEPTVRHRVEVELYSADVYAYLTASPYQWAVRPIVRAYPRPEGLFPGFIPLLLAAWGIATAVRNGWIATRGSPLPATQPRWLSSLKLAVTVGALGLVSVETLRILLSLAAVGPALHIQYLLPTGRHFLRCSARVAVGLAVLLCVSPRARALARGALRSRTAFLLACAGTAFAFSLGPTIKTLGHVIWIDAPYDWFYRLVPGVDGLRVPARFAMIVALFLSLLAGLAARRLGGLWRRRGLLGLALAGVFLVESAVVPLPLNGSWAPRGIRKPPPLGAEVPRIYRAVATLPREAVLVELPMGLEIYDVRYMFYSTRHWRRLVNGKSGAAPRSYDASASAIMAVPLDKHALRRAVLETGATHVVVHEGAWGRDRGRKMTAALVAGGARWLARQGDDVLLELRDRPTPSGPPTPRIARLEEAPAGR